MSSNWPSNTELLRNSVLDRISTKPFFLLIDGKLVRASENSQMQVFNPSTGEPLTTVPHAQKQDVAAAVEAGQRAQPKWHGLGVRGRRAYLEHLSRVVTDHVEELAMLDSLSGGNPFPEMVKDVKRTIHQFVSWSAIAEMDGGRTVPISPNNLHFTELAPYGVVARIIPFNHPSYSAIKAIIPPLIMGNAVILKPSDQSPLSALRLAELFSDVLPPGILSVLSGNGETGDYLVRHPAIKRIGFTGSVSVGKRILASAASVAIKNVSMELGGKNAMVVFPDAPIQTVAKAALRGMNLGVCQGQSCGSTSRVFAHRDIHGDLVAAIAAELEHVKVGPAYEQGTTMGPLVSVTQRDKVAAYVSGAIDAGARLVKGGAAPPSDLPPGFYLPPTLFDGVQQDMKIAKEEIFGPVISVFEWDDQDDMLSRVNDVEYGLTASIWTDDLHDALHTARAIDAGFIWINEVTKHYWGMPFGGTKNSGLGRQENLEELATYGETKAINVITREVS